MEHDKLEEAEITVNRYVRALRDGTITDAQATYLMFATQTIQDAARAVIERGY